jgi:hypothetical protein
MPPGGAGFVRTEQLVTALAIARAESGWRSDAVNAADAAPPKWGPSIGLFQIRSLVADRGTGRARDETRLRDPLFNARSAYSISGGGRDWSPWTVFRTGAYRQYLAAARAAAGVA